MGANRQIKVAQFCIYHVLYVWVYIWVAVACAVCDADVLRLFLLRCLLQVLQYLEQHGAVVDVAAREIDTRASRATAAGRR
jgi:hypothetical protein